MSGSMRHNLPTLDSLMMTRVTHTVGEGVPGDPVRLVHDYFDQDDKFVFRVDEWEQDFGAPAPPPPQPTPSNPAIDRSPGSATFRVMTKHSGVKNVRLHLQDPGEFEDVDIKGDKDYVVVRFRIKEGP